MGKRQDPEPRKTTLRRRAEQSVAAHLAEKIPAGTTDPARLLRELEIHQVELEIQNEELRAARVETEAALQRYRELFDFAPIGYLVLTGDGSILEANVESSRLIGVSRRALKGKRLGAFVDERQRVAFAELLGNVFTAEDDSRRSLEAALPQNGADPFYVHLVAAPIDRPERAALVAIHDITAQKRAEAALEDEVRRRDEFLANLSHELRNPLAPIRTALAVLDRAEPGTKPALSAKAIIGRQVEHLVHIVGDLLDAARIARGRIHLQREVIDLGEVVRHAVYDYRSSFEARGVALEYPAGVQQLLVDADAVRLAQVLSNLLGNALKFTPRGGRVDVRLGKERGQAVITVRDSGMGVARDVLSRLFRPFVQAPQSLERPTGGLGLGLALVKGLVEQHGGTVAGSSEGIGQGCEFTVRLPLVAEQLKVTLPPEPSESQSQSRKVLIIEDSVDAGDLLRDLLVHEGHEVELAYDGPTGLRMAREFHPEVVFCDIGLPGMNGYQVARAMRADRELRGSRLVALTGYARAEDQQRAMEAGFHRHIAKPLSVAALQDALAP
jgi:PAS domain S-box-containing protein